MGKQSVGTLGGESSQPGDAPWLGWQRSVGVKHRAKRASWASPGGQQPDPEDKTNSYLEELRARSPVC